MSHSKRRSLGFVAPAALLLIVRVVAIVSAASLATYEAYEKFYLQPRREAEVSRMKDQLNDLKTENNLLKKQNDSFGEEHEAIRGWLQDVTRMKPAELRSDYVRGGASALLQSIIARETERAEGKGDKIE